uniref:Uncharacterized protein n=1 Tax=Candidatus Kentrum sp. TUN TaxID=2126343 RepID=A0A451B112_9GAMM|nr:MAG: hypothetical protein BECKTUN1418F_GA0071002_13291 [Candidatus Kentron sp. TUN]VFK71962.1 MAG: hypothetical protein BECKTUN1418E_GA0071001_13251 [Candidatus Kentron sp. TUN]
MGKAKALAAAISVIDGMEKAALDKLEGITDPTLVEPLPGYLKTDAEQELQTSQKNHIGHGGCVAIGELELEIGRLNRV